MNELGYIERMTMLRYRSKHQNHLFYHFFNSYQVETHSNVNMKAIQATGNTWQFGLINIEMLMNIFGKLYHALESY